MKKIFAVLALFIVVLTGAYYLVKPANQPASNNNTLSAQSPGLQHPMIGKKAIDFTLKDMSGQEVTLSKLQGKAVMLNFWATWCPPCKEEMPAIQEYYAKKMPQDAVILAINILQRGDTPEIIQEFIAANQLTFPVLLDETVVGVQRKTTEITAAYGVTGIPTTFFIDKAGIIRDVFTGPLTLEEIESKMEKARN